MAEEQASAATHAPALPDMHPGNVAPMVCKQLGVPGVVMITSNADGTMMMIAHGVNHARANEMLSRSVQINLNQHDEFVRQGMAGLDAQAHQAFIDSGETAATGAMQ